MGAGWFSEPVAARGVDHQVESPLGGRRRERLAGHDREGRLNRMERATRESHERGAPVVVRADQHRPLGLGDRFPEQPDGGAFQALWTGGAHRQRKRRLETSEAQRC